MYIQYKLIISFTTNPYDSKAPCKRGVGAHYDEAQAGGAHARGVVPPIVRRCHPWQACIIVIISITSSSSICCCCCYCC